MCVDSNIEKFSDVKNMVCTRRARVNIVWAQITFYKGIKEKKKQFHYFLL